MAVPISRFAIRFLPTCLKQLVHVDRQSEAASLRHPLLESVFSALAFTLFIQWLLRRSIPCVMANFASLPSTEEIHSYEIDDFVTAPV